MQSDNATTWDRAARAAAAAAIAAVPISAAHAQTPIEPGNLGTYTAADFDGGEVEFDVDGDGLNDFSLDSFYGFDLLISPLANATPGAALLVDGGSEVTRFENAQDVFAAAVTSDSTDTSRDLIFFDDPASRFLDPGYLGLLFEIPGGSPYIAAIQIDVDVDQFGDFVQVEILGGFYQPVPAPGAATLAGLALAAGLRRRR